MRSVVDDPARHRETLCKGSKAELYVSARDREKGYRCANRTGGKANSRTHGGVFFWCTSRARLSDRDRKGEDSLSSAVLDSRRTNGLAEERVEGDKRTSLVFLRVLVTEDVDALRPDSSEWRRGGRMPLCGEGESGEMGGSSMAGLGESIDRSSVNARGEGGLWIAIDLDACGGGRLNENEIDRLVGEAPHAGRCC